MRKFLFSKVVTRTFPPCLVQKFFQNTETIVFLDHSKFDMETILSPAKNFETQIGFEITGPKNVLEINGILAKEGIKLFNFKIKKEKRDFGKENSNYSKKPSTFGMRSNVLDVKYQEKIIEFLQDKIEQEVLDEFLKDSVNQDS